MIDTFRT